MVAAGAGRGNRPALPNPTSGAFAGKDGVAISACARCYHPGDIASMSARGSAMTRAFAFAFAILACVLFALPAQADPRLVIVVRHAEKAEVPGSDPPLSTAGRARAEALADALADAGVGTVITTQLARTRQTAAPLAARIGIVPQVVEAASGQRDAHVAAVADAVRRADGVVLVVGHSNTVMQIVAALGGPEAADLDDQQYDVMLLVQPVGGVVRARFGAGSGGG
jgi:phosphohistidine phosphatase SixA